ncbi:BTAD domain-containing putative transcriptional regulator [Streptomyces sp. NPDC002120]|uniref:BTAD domain-containing putative transcriptional regulator n=1 Tax=Streptomyces sp. NPDC002120 TaxID=3364631 RepID=UPI003695F73D
MNWSPAGRHGTRLARPAGQVAQCRHADLDAGGPGHTGRGRNRRRSRGNTTARTADSAGARTGAGGRRPALLDVAAADFFRAPVTRLSELRMAVLEDRIEADLRVGRGRELTGELPEGRWRGWPMPSRRPRPAALPPVRRGPGLARGPTGSQGATRARPVPSATRRTRWATPAMSTSWTTTLVS